MWTKNAAHRLFEDMALVYTGVTRGYDTVDGRLSELCSSFLKGGNSVFIAVIASGLFPQTEYRSLE